MTAAEGTMQTDLLAQLITRIGEKDESALTELYDATIARVLALARRISGNEADADEVVCDVYGQVWDTAPTFDDRRGGVMAWLMMLCRSRALDLVRRNTARGDALRRHAAQTMAPGHWDPVNDVGVNTMLHQALRRLDPERRQIVGLAYFRGLTHAEISRVTALPLGTVKSHVRRGLLALREHFERLGGHHVDTR